MKYRIVVLYNPVRKPHYLAEIRYFSGQVAFPFAGLFARSEKKARARAEKFLARVQETDLNDHWTEIV